MTAILMLCPIYGYATIFNIYFKRKPSVSIFFAITFIITILFTFGMFDVLEYGSYGLFYTGIGLLLYSSIKSTQKSIYFFLSVPVVIYTVMSILYFYMMQDAQFFFWDEYSHWGAFIKEMYYFGHFYDATSVAANLSYPPGISTWDYFIVSNLFFSEGNIYFAYFLLLFSATLMMYEKLTFKDIHWIILVLIIQMVIFASFGHWFSSIYVDHVVGAMFAGIILTYLVDNFNAKQFVLFIFPLLSIVLVKEVGLYFGAVSVGLLLILQVIRSKSENNRSFFFNIKLQKSVILILLFLLLFVALVLKSWQNRQESLGIVKPSHSISKIAENIILNKQVFGESKNSEYKKRFFEVVLYQQVHKEKVSLNYNEFSYNIMPKYTKSIKLSTVGSFVFFIFICLVTYLSISRKNKKIEVIIVCSYMLFTSLIYLFILYFSFPLSFGDRALQMVSYIRYVNMNILPLMFIGFSLMLSMKEEKIEQDNKNKHELKLFVSSLVLIVILAFFTKPYLSPMYSQLQNGFRVSVDKAAVNILKVVPKKSTVFVIFPIKNNGSLNNIMKYSLIPTRATVSSNNFSQKTTEDMISIYAKYDYIWFASLNNEIMSKNKAFLRQKGEKNIFTLYKIERNNSEIQIKPIM